MPNLIGRYGNDTFIPTKQCNEELFLVKEKIMCKFVLAI